MYAAVERFVEGALDGVVVTDDRAFTHRLGHDVHHHRPRLLDVLQHVDGLVAVEQHQAQPHKQQQAGGVQAIDPVDQRLGQPAFETAHGQGLKGQRSEAGADWKKRRYDA
jgi:hypothetical protein